MIFKPKTKAWICLWIVFLFWGLTYAGVVFGLQNMPPLFISWLRMLIPGLALLTWCFANGEKMPSQKNLALITIAGFFMLFIISLSVPRALKFIPSGLTALLFTLLPIFILIIEVLVTREEKFNSFALIGILIGLAGLTIIYLGNPEKLKEGNYFMGVILVLVAVMSWAVGSIFAKKIPNSVSSLFISGWQLLSSSLALIPVSYFTESWSDVKFNTNAFLALAFLVITDSIVCFTCFLYAQRYLPATVVSLYAYVNMVVALFFGWAFLNEPMNLTIIAGSVLTLVGVWLVNKSYSRVKTLN